MKRPTCKTCVHFVGGECWKEPPSPVVVDDLSGGTMARPWIPPVHESYGCSHHPDFPAYVASMKRPDERPCPDVEYWTESRARHAKHAPAPTPPDSPA